MYYYSKTSKNKIIHTDACRYRHAISQNHMGYLRHLLRHMRLAIVSARLAAPWLKCSAMRKKS